MNHQLKLIEINKKRLDVLLGQKKYFGFHCPPHIVTEIKDIRADIVEIESELKRRLQGLLLQSATKGINTDSSITIEIEDIQEYFEKLK